MKQSASFQGLNIDKNSIINLEKYLLNISNKDKDIMTYKIISFAKSIIL